MRRPWVSFATLALGLVISAVGVAFLWTWPAALIWFGVGLPVTEAFNKLER